MSVVTAARKAESCDTRRDGAVEGEEEGGQPQHAVQVEVVGRLVQQQHVRLQEHRRSQCHAHSPSAAQRSRGPALRRLAEAELVQRGGRARLGTVAVDGREAVVDGHEGLAVLGLAGGQPRGLRQQCGALCVGVEHLLQRSALRPLHLLRDEVTAQVRREARDLPARDAAKESTLAAAIFSDQAVAVALQQAQGGGRQQLVAVDGDGDVQEADVLDCAFGGQARSVGLDGGHLEGVGEQRSVQGIREVRHLVVGIDACCSGGHDRRVGAASVGVGQDGRRAQSTATTV